MLKRLIQPSVDVVCGQPPSGGCVLKPQHIEMKELKMSQPPSGGCVLKHLGYSICRHRNNQPPSGGCVLKPLQCLALPCNKRSAAFGRLCVETLILWLEERAFLVSRLRAAVC